MSNDDRRSFAFYVGIIFGFFITLLVLLLVTLESNSKSDPLASDDASLISKFSIIKQIMTLEDKEEEELAKLELEVSRLNEDLVELTKNSLESSSIPLGLGKSPPNMPALVDFTPKEKQDMEKKRNELPGYGGKGDKLHLGGFTANDTDGQSPSLWEWMLKRLTVKSFLDVGCGRGISTKFFKDHGADVLCVEGSHDALKSSLLPRDRIVAHDYYRGPWWPDRTYDVVWSVEFLEHIGRHKAENYMATFKKAALIFVTFSGWGGWHHVEVHPDGQYWLYRFAAQGFIYLPDLTKKVRMLAQGSRGDGFRGQHLWLHLLVFVNPRVASLPEHAHLYGGPGCYVNPGYEACKGLDEIPKSFRPVWSQKSKYDGADLEMAGMPIDVIDDDAVSKSKEKGPGKLRIR